jgi:hypothetical protein
MSGKPEISDEDLNNFCAVTGASVERAKFFVEAANGNLEVALYIYFYFYFQFLFNFKFYTKFNIQKKIR